MQAWAGATEGRGCALRPPERAARLGGHGPRATDERPPEGHKAATEVGGRDKTEAKPTSPTNCKHRAGEAQGASARQRTRATHTRTAKRPGCTTTPCSQASNTHIKLVGSENICAETPTFVELRAMSVPCPAKHPDDCASRLRAGNRRSTYRDRPEESLFLLMPPARGGSRCRKRCLKGVSDEIHCHAMCAHPCARGTTFACVGAVRVTHAVNAVSTLYQASRSCATTCHGSPATVLVVAWTASSALLFPNIRCPRPILSVVACMQSAQRSPPPRLPQNTYLCDPSFRGDFLRVRLPAFCPSPSTRGYGVVPLRNAALLPLQLAPYKASQCGQSSTRCGDKRATRRVILTCIARICRHLPQTTILAESCPPHRPRSGEAEER